MYFDTEQDSLYSRFCNCLCFCFKGLSWDAVDPPEKEYTHNHFQIITFSKLIPYQVTTTLPQIHK